jgi:Uncharacterised protein family (UPF0236)
VGVKKLYWHSRFGRIEVLEQRFIQFGKSARIVRPFQTAAEVHCRGYSMPLQRVITDFGADVPFGQIPKKLLEHHGVSVPISSAQGIAQTHAQLILDTRNLETQFRTEPGVASLITQMDGSMIPVVETSPSESDTEQVDRRTTRKIGWAEARLGFSRTPEQTLPIFGATLGSVDDAGAQLLDSAIRAGLGIETFVHGVGDGAPWIATQVELQFGGSGRYLLDFYHLCDYLADASRVCAPHDPQAWMEQQKRRLKRNYFGAVLKTLKPYREPDGVPDPQAPVRAAYRYLLNRPNHLDYQGAITSELPIGSGEIESAHRYIIQIRLKRSGSWWTVENAEAMLALRVLRANQDWDAYWLNLSCSDA